MVFQQHLTAYAQRPLRWPRRLQELNRPDKDLRLKGYVVVHQQDMGVAIPFLECLQHPAGEAAATAAVLVGEYGNMGMLFWLNSFSVVDYEDVDIITGRTIPVF